MTLVAIALGSNLGDRQARLDQAAMALDMAPGVRVVALSHVYESAPWGDTDQGPFLNSVLLAEVSIPPAELLSLTQATEERLGKRVLRRWGPRTIDIDILTFGAQASRDPALLIPHPRIADRPFVFLPLNELAAEMDLAKVKPSEEGSACLPDTRRLPAAGIWPSNPRPPHRAVLTSDSEERTMAVGIGLGKAARPGDVFALDGPVGAGKSVLARGIARGLGITGPVQSPTFALCREHSGTTLRMRHWDFYRLGDHDDLESTGFGQDPDTVQVIEWAGLFRADLPNCLSISLELAGSQRRTLAVLPAKGQLHLRAAMEDWPC